MRSLRTRARMLIWTVGATALTAGCCVGIMARGDMQVAAITARTAERNARAEILRIPLARFGSTPAARADISAKAADAGERADSSAGVLRAADSAGRIAGVSITALSFAPDAGVFQSGRGLQARDLVISARGPFHGLVLFFARLGTVDVPIEVRSVRVLPHPDPAAGRSLLDATIDVRSYPLPGDDRVLEREPDATPRIAVRRDPFAPPTGETDASQTPTQHM